MLMDNTLSLNIKIGVLKELKKQDLITNLELEKAIEILLKKETKNGGK